MMWIQPFSLVASMDWGTALLASGAACVLFVTIGGVRRVWFDPLSQFPGSKFAALTLWNEFYWDVVRRGTFMWRIRDMHEKYGTRMLQRLTGASAAEPHGTRC